MFNINRSLVLKRISLIGLIIAERLGSIITPLGVEYLVNTTTGKNHKRLYNIDKTTTKKIIGNTILKLITKVVNKSNSEKNLGNGGVGTEIRNTKVIKTPIKGITLIQLLIKKRLRDPE